MAQNIKSVPCTHIPVTNVERAIEFWTENFGCVFGDEYTPGALLASLRVEDGHWFFLYETDQLPHHPRAKCGVLNNSDDNQIFIATLNVKDPQNLYESLSERGVKVGALREVWTGYAFDCYDPDGHKFNIWGGDWKEV